MNFEFVYEGYDEGYDTDYDQDIAESDDDLYEDPFIGPAGEPLDWSLEFVGRPRWTPYYVPIIDRPEDCRVYHEFEYLDLMITCGCKPCNYTKEILVRETRGICKTVYTWEI